MAEAIARAFPLVQAVPEQTHQPILPTVPTASQVADRQLHTLGRGLHFGHSPGRSLAQQSVEADGALDRARLVGRRDPRRRRVHDVARLHGRRHAPRGGADDRRRPAQMGQGQSRHTTSRKTFRMPSISWRGPRTRYAGEATPIRWLCRGTIPLGVPVLVAAMGGLGKSYLALDLALHAAAGVVGLEQPRLIFGGRLEGEGTAVLITAEDSFDAIHRRLNRIDPKARRLRHPAEAHRSAHVQRRRCPAADHGRSQGR